MHVNVYHIEVELAVYKISYIQVAKLTKVTAIEFSACIGPVFS